MDMGGDAFLAGVLARIRQNCPALFSDERSLPARVNSFREYSLPNQHVLLVMVKRLTAFLGNFNDGGLRHVQLWRIWSCWMRRTCLQVLRWATLLNGSQLPHLARQDLSRLTMSGRNLSRQSRHIAALRKGCPFRKWSKCVSLNKAEAEPEKALLEGAEATWRRFCPCECVCWPYNSDWVPHVCQTGHRVCTTASFFATCRAARR